MVLSGLYSGRTWTILVLVLAVISAGGCTEQGGKVIVVSAPASLQEVFDELARG
jgi:ABC-type molybdate transport system substrate-binding protein